MSKKCYWCNGTGKKKVPHTDEDTFDNFVDREMDKGYFVNADIAMNKAYEYFGYHTEKCEHCNGTGIESEK